MQTLLLQRISFCEAQLRNQNTVNYESEPRIIEREGHYSIEKLQAVTKREPSILLALFELSFYEKILGTENRVNKDLYFKTADYYNYESVISPLFKKSVVSLVRLNGQEKMYQVVVRGITHYGHAAIQLLQDIPEELQQLYCSDCQVDNYSCEGLYKLSLNSAKALNSTSQAFKVLINHSSIKSLDISCFALPQLCQSPIPQYLISRYNEVYLNIEVYPKTDIRLTRLIWGNKKVTPLPG